MNILRAYSHLFSRYRWRYMVGLMALLATNVVYLAIPRVIGLAVDALEGGATQSSVLIFSGVIAGLAVVQAVARVASRILVLSVSRRVEYDLKGMLHDRLVRLAPSFYEALSTGDLMSRLTNDVMLVRALGGPGVLYFANAVLVYVVGVFFMVSLSWQLTLVVLAPLPVMAWVVRGMVHRVRAYALASRQALSAVNTVVQENLTGAHVVRSFALERAQSRLFAEGSQDYVGWALKESWARAQMIPLIGLSGGLAYVGVLGLGAPLVASGTVSLGDLVAFLSYVAMMIFPTVALGWILSLMQRGAAALERLDEVLAAPITIVSGPVTGGVGSNRSSARGEIQIRGLTFRYDDALDAYGGLGVAEGGPKRRAALAAVELDVGAGEFVVLVGRVGSGKSTLLKAFVRLIEVPVGSVRLDGVDVTSLDLDWLRRQIAYVPQDDFLFADTVGNNIAFGSPAAAPDQVLEAARVAGLDPEATGLAMEAEVGERGANLSGGQRQRVALARALLRNAPILLLDNALSNVDTDTERQILRGLASARRGRTVVAASNRITAIRDAVRIVVFDGGRIVDVGTHTELVGRGGLYSMMDEQQRLSARLERY